MSGYVEGKTKNQILAELAGTAQPGSPIHEQQRMGILVRATEDIEAAVGQLNQSVVLLDKSIRDSSRSNENLAKKVFWLNVVLTAATVVGTAFAGYSVFRSNSPPLPATQAVDSGEAGRFTWAFAQNLDNSLQEAELCRQSLAESLYVPGLAANITRQGQSNIFLYVGATESYRVHAFHSQSACEAALTGLKSRASQ